MREAAAASTAKALREAKALCEWMDDSNNFALHLIPSLMSRLGIESWMAFKQIPRRGLEIGGILLGRTEAQENRAQVWIDGYRTIDSEHRAGPSYLLSDSDLERLREEVRISGPGAVGLFRTHTRSEAPALDPADAEMLDQCFPGGLAILLLLAPVAGKAVFFARAQGELQRVYECALSSSLSSILALRQDRLAAAGQPLHRPEPHPTIATAVQVQPPLLPPPPPPVTSPVPVLDKKWLAGAALATLSLVVIAALAVSSRRTPLDTVTPPFLRLTVQPVGSSLHLNWDPKAPALQGAVYAILHIDDGGDKNDRPLNASELFSGAASYQPHSSNVSFRLDVYPSEPKASGLVQIFNFGPAAPDQPAVDTPKSRRAPRSPANRPADPTTLSKEDPPEPPAPLPVKPIPQPVATNLRGISAEPLSAGLRNRLRVPSGASGVVITGVRPKTPAFEAVLQEGDVIEEVNRRPIAGVADFEHAMQQSANTAVLLSVSRGGVLSFRAIPPP